jgi:transcriptional regulator with PAS, ATPase and Fis domain
MNEIADIDYPSPVMKKVLASCRQAAARDSTVLLLGESGSGKDFLSDYIHRRSIRAAGPFFPVNCAAIAKDLAESELFGHEAGAFTGARYRKKGLIELANQGTLMLNELGDLELPLQAKLLQFLDKKGFIRVGGEKIIRVNVRIIAATNKNLSHLMSEGRFRQDLFYRLSVMEIVVPPLRDRKEDIPGLAQNFLRTLKGEMGLHCSPQLQNAAVRKLVYYSWPGNVRELRNVLERAVIYTDGAQTIDANAIIAVLNNKWNGAAGPKQKGKSVKISDEYLKRMIWEVFGDAPTPVEVVRTALGWGRKKASTAVKRVGSRPGTAGRLPITEKEEMICALRRWLQENGIL